MCAGMTPQQQQAVQAVVQSCRDSHTEVKGRRSADVNAARRGTANMLLAGVSKDARLGRAISKLFGISRRAIAEAHSRVVAIAEGASNAIWCLVQRKQRSDACSQRHPQHPTNQYFAVLGDRTECPDHDYYLLKATKPVFIMTAGRKDPTMISLLGQLL